MDSFQEGCLHRGIHSMFEENSQDRGEPFMGFPTCPQDLSFPQPKACEDSSLPRVQANPDLAEDPYESL